MVLTVVSQYPSNKDLYNNMFVHSRVKSYRDEGISAEVFVLNKRWRNDYCFDGVSVMCGDEHSLVKLINESTDITCVCFHFLTPAMVRSIQRIDRQLGIIIFVHGNEALWWFQRIFPDRLNGPIRFAKFVRYALINTASILQIRSRIPKLNQVIHIVGVSEWMKSIAVKNWRLDEGECKTHIIPNIIDNNEFPYIKKDPALRYRILMIRSFSNGKYALDIAMDIIKALQNYPEAERLHFSVFGDGPFFEKYTSRIRGFPNVSIEQRFLNHAEIAEQHKQHGFFLCPTRQDAQGVSMCEAMSSGLVPISSNNSAISEFLPSEYNLAFPDAEKSAQRIVEIIRDKELFEDLSSNVASFMRCKCSKEQTIEKEIALMKDFDS